MRLLTFSFLALITISTLAEGANILAVLFNASKSHKNVYDPLLKELAKRGHSVTVISPIKPSSEIPNIRNIVGTGQITTPNPFNARLKGEKINFKDMVQNLTIVCQEYYENPEIIELAKSGKFDLVFTTLFVNDCAYGFIHHLKAPVILVSTVAAGGHAITITGTPQLPSVTPLILTGYSDRMDFFQRVVNFASGTLFGLFRDYYIVPQMESAYKDYYPNAPGVHEFEKNITLVFSNGHFSLNYARPMMPDLIDVGGMHCRPANPLPKEIDEFLLGSGKDGFIYFSLGSIVKGSEMPENIRKSFIEAFSKLKQRVLWKWETEDMPDLPPNVRLMKWVPQQDVLGHPNIRFFITHGGLLSTQESVYHGVPLIGIPFFGDQDNNVIQSENAGYALGLELRNISTEIVLKLCNRLLTEPQYGNSFYYSKTIQSKLRAQKGENMKKYNDDLMLNCSRFNIRAKELSKIFRDQPEKPLDRAVFWTEYVIRHKGAIHMRSPARDLNFWQYHSIDVIASAITLAISFFYILYKLLRICCRKICGFRSKHSSAKKTN